MISDGLSGKTQGAFLHRYLHRCHRGAGFLPSLVFILNILFKKGFCPLPFRYAPVTVGSGHKADCAYTQGDTLGQELLGLQPVWGKVSKVPLHRPCGTSRVSCRSFLQWISSLCSHLLAQIHNKNLRQGDNPPGDLLWSGPIAKNLRKNITIK